MTKAWREKRAYITRLYIHENKTLNQVKAIMEEDHDFKASSVSPLLPFFFFLAYGPFLFFPLFFVFVFVWNGRSPSREEKLPLGESFIPLVGFHGDRLCHNCHASDGMDIRTRLPS